MTTIKDIAQRANVAPSTVSNVLNNSKYVSDEIRQRVYEAVDALGYKPNLTARSLKTKHSNLVGVIVSELSAFFVEMLSEIEAFFHGSGYSVVVSCSGGDRAMTRQYLDNFSQRGMDGLLFLEGGSAPVELLEQLDVPVVLLDQLAPGAKLACVAFDNEQGGYLAARHLLESGARRIAFVNGRTEAATQVDRERGYRRALREWGLEPIPALTVHCGWLDYASGRRAAKQFLESGCGFDAVFATNDFVAAGVQKALAQAGISVPHQVQIVGFGDFSVAEMLTPTLTTVSQPRAQMGLAAAKKLYLSMEGELPEKQKVSLFSPGLVVRESTRG